jgi:hypothetical protein
MLNIGGAGDLFADQFNRRAALKVGALALGGLSLADLLRLRAAAGPAAMRTETRQLGDHVRREPLPARDVAVIQIFMGGGPSHLDMYDMKPEAPSEIRGEFHDIPTAVSGIRVCEHLATQAQAMDKLAIVRSVTHSTATHLIASQWMLTGYQVSQVTTDNIHPSHGSVVAKLRGANSPGMPAYVALPRKTAYGNAAYLGPAYNPFTTEGDLTAANFSVRDLRLPRQVTSGRLSDRRALLTGLDTIRRDLDSKGELAGIDRFDREAIDMITSDRAVRAFDIRQESPALRSRYGRTSLGQGCLLARRLVEAGVTFVTVLSGAVWDTHQDNFNILKTNSLPKVDRAIAALVTDLHERGLDKNVLVMALGEFGRTPVINRNAGRDHWPGAMSVVFGGGGLRMGQSIGRTDSHGAHPISRSFTPGDVAATMYHVLGIDTTREFRDASGRIFPALREGRPITELV